MTILTSLLGTKVLSLLIFMWQEAAASPAGTPEVDHFSLMSIRAWASRNRWSVVLLIRR